MQHTVIAKGDSAATGHYFTVNDACVLEDIKKERGHPVILPDNDVIGSTHGAQLLTPTPLPKAATKTAILPRLTSSSLVSLPQLCNHGCQVLLTDTDLHVVQNGNFVLENNRGTQVLHGVRNQLDRLWDIQIPQKPTTFQQKRKIQQEKLSIINPYHINYVNMNTLSTTIKNISTARHSKFFNLFICNSA